ncbi:MAG: hypothetical protein RJB39_612 [Candidatus Parcubacteria bacterium]|jgi:predicted house-cleaning noncanonical NTP pyrophosphatase (MazG superfamily)
MATYNKLVRDKIPEILDKKGISYEKRIASPEEYKTELVTKLQEEVDEFKAETDIEELADVMEVLESLKNLPEYSGAEEVRLRKREERGGFDDRIILKGEK